MCSKALLLWQALEAWPSVPPRLVQWSRLFSCTCATVQACEGFLRSRWFDELEKEKKAVVILK